MTVAIGIDGCKGGWFFFRFEDGIGTFGAAASIGEILDVAPADTRALIDIPIRLKERGKTERECDLLAREMLRPKRHSSVFPAHSEAQHRGITVLISRLREDARRSDHRQDGGDGDDHGDQRQD